VPVQGRIKVRGGPRLDTVMEPYPSFISYYQLRTLRVWGIVRGNYKLQMLAGEFYSMLTELYVQSVRMNLQFLPAQRITVDTS